MQAHDGVAARQYGLVSSAQLDEIYGPARRRRLIRAGGVEMLGLGVYRCAGAPPSWRQRAMAVCLSYGPPVAISHRSAGRLWALEAVASPEIEVTVPRVRSGRRQGAVTHRGRLGPGDVSERFDIPVTPAGRTIVDLAGVVGPIVLERALDDALRRRLTDIADICARLEGRRGGAGQAELRRLIEARTEFEPEGDSQWVDRIFGWILAAGLPPPARQHPVTIAGTPRWLDIAYPQLRIAIEFNGWDFHGGRRRSDLDHARTTELELAGWLVIVVTSAHERAAVVDRVRRAVEMRSGQGRTAVGR